MVGGARHPLQVVLQARYLTVTFQAGEGCLSTFTDLCSKALRAWALLWQQCGKRACGRTMWLMLQLYVACVVPDGHVRLRGGPSPSLGLLASKGRFGCFAPATSQEARGH